MTYKEHLHEAMLKLAEADQRVVFVGYNTRYSGQAGGTLAGVPESQLIEMPLAENLMAGAAIGMSIAGLFPVIYFERFDFILNALDAIVNHLDKLRALSDQQFCPAAIIRVVVGNKNKPLYTGLTHTQDFWQTVGRMLHFPSVRLERPDHIEPCYAAALNNLRQRQISTMLVEYKDLYDHEG